MENTYYLQARYDARKSFYNKAEVQENKDELILYSYGAKVASIKNGRAEVYNLQSQTTTRHIKEFLKQNGYFVDTRKQIEKDYYINQ